MCCVCVVGDGVGGVEGGGGGGRGEGEGERERRGCQVHEITVHRLAFGQHTTNTFIYLCFSQRTSPVVFS